MTRQDLKAIAQGLLSHPWRAIQYWSLELVIRLLERPSRKRYLD